MEETGLEVTSRAKPRNKAYARSHGLCERCFRHPVAQVPQLSGTDLDEINSEDFLGLCAQCVAWTEGSGEVDCLTPEAASVGRMLRHYGLIKEFEPEVNLELTRKFSRWQRLLPGSQGEEYLIKRGVPLEVAEEFGLGYAPEWISAEVPEGRIVFPATNPQGEVLSVLARAARSEVSEQERWAWEGFRPSYFGGEILGKVSAKRLVVVRNPFDLLALKMAEKKLNENLAVLALGFSSWRWLWAMRIQSLVLTFTPTRTEDIAGLERECKLLVKQFATTPVEGPYPELIAAWKNQDVDYLHGFVEKLKITFNGSEKDA